MTFPPLPKIMYNFISADCYGAKNICNWFGGNYAWLIAAWLSLPLPISCKPSLRQSATDVKVNISVNQRPEQWAVMTVGMEMSVGNIKISPCYHQIVWVFYDCRGAANNEWSAPTFVLRIVTQS